MPQQSGSAIGRIQPVTILSLSPIESDHDVLRCIVSHSRWTLFKADRVSTAQNLVREHEVSVVLCERDLAPGTWIDMLHEIHNLPSPPSLIVTSRTADERLWAEALNLGAWDVLAKPFDRLEVLRSIRHAWQHRHDQIQLTAVPIDLMEAAG
jgi:DNA-binding NtrC family response regulator